MTLRELQNRELLSIPMADFDSVENDLKNMLYQATKPRQIDGSDVYLTESP